MTISFPTSIDPLTTFANNIAPGDARNTAPNATGANASHAAQHNNLSDAVRALETSVGITASADTASLRYLVQNAASANPGHTHSTTSITSVSEDNIITTFPGKYALLAGRSGGQTLYGDTAASGGLVLVGTNNATGGKIYFGAGALSAYDEVNGRLGILTASPSVTLQVVGKGLFSGAFTSGTLFSITGAANGSGTFPVLFGLTSTFSGAADIVSPIAMNFQPTFSPPNAQNWSGTATLMNMGLLTGSAGGTITAMTAMLIFTSYGSVKPTTVNGISINNIGSASITTSTAILVAAQSGSTTNYGIVSAAVLNGFGTAAPTAALHVVGTAKLGGGEVTFRDDIATPAAGSTSARVVFGTTSGFGIYYGSGAPTVSAAKGSIYLRSDGSGVADRLYVNTNGTTTWTNFVSAA